MQAPDHRADRPSPGRNPVVIVLGGSGDIGSHLVKRFAQAGRSAVATYRSEQRIERLRQLAGVTIEFCDISDGGSVADLVRRLADAGIFWDVLVSAIGTLEPIDGFLRGDFAAWEMSMQVNWIGQLRALHGLYPLRAPDGLCHVCYLAGGGTNGPFTNYSAYCVSKIVLIKMCELIDDETPDVNLFAIGPGYVATRIHQQTLQNPEKAGANYDRTLAFLETKGTDPDDIFAHLQWCIGQGRAVAGGRNFSTRHDPWREDRPGFVDRLRGDRNLLKLRRNFSC